MNDEAIAPNQQADFRNAMALLTSAVNVVTTDGTAGRAGITASAVCSVTDTPPMLLVCVNRTSYAHRFFVENGVMCINILDASQRTLSEIFASRDITMAGRFAAADWGRLASGAPTLRQALVNLDGKIAGLSEQGSHTIFFVELTAIAFGNGEASEGLAYFNRAYHRIPTALVPPNDRSGAAR